MADEKQKQFKLSFVEHFGLSATAAVIGQVAAPIERVKLLLQNQHEMIKQGKLSEPYKGVINCTVRTFKNEGLLPFWRGNLANIIRIFPNQAFNFALKEKIKSIFKQNKADGYLINFSKNIASGGAAGAMSLCFVYSLDFARTKLATDAMSSKKEGSREYSGLIDVYRKTLASDGIQGLYRGFVISCVGIVVYRGCYFGFYDSLKPILLGDNAGVAASFVLGYVVTITSGLISYPIDTIRRRMMMTSGQAVKYKGSIDCTVQILKNEGAMSLMKGAGANILRGVAGAGVLAGFDKIKEVYITMRKKQLGYA